MATMCCIILWNMALMLVENWQNSSVTGQAMEMLKHSSFIYKLHKIFVYILFGVFHINICQMY